jgi:hypothetical protein
MGLQHFKNTFLREYVCNQRRNEPFEEKFMKHYTDFLVEPSDPYPVKLFLILIRPGQKVRDPAGSGSTTLSSRTCTGTVCLLLYNIHIKRRIDKRTNRCVECALQEQFGLEINYSRPRILSNNFKITPKPKNPEKKGFWDISKLFHIVPHIRYKMLLYDNQGVTKRCRLSWLTYCALVCQPKWGGGEGGCAGSQPMNTAVHVEPK